MMRITRPFIERGQKIPNTILDSLERYVNDRVQTGSFLRAVLENDFITAATKCDHINQHCLTAIALCITNLLPTECYGSKDKVEEWLNPKTGTIQLYSNDVIESLIDDTYDAKHAKELVIKHSKAIAALYLEGKEPEKTAKLILHLEKKR